MNTFLLWFLIGLAIGVPIFFAGLGIYLVIKRTLERRKVKRLISNGEFLTPIDPKDYNTKMWGEKIEITQTEEDLKNFNDNIFVKPKEELVLSKSKEFVKKCRELGYEDEFIVLELKKKNYSQELINKIFEGIRNEQNNN